MAELDWKNRKDRLDRFTGKAEPLAPDEQAFLVETVAALLDETEKLHKRALHLEERADSLSKQLTMLESRVHEEVD